MKGVMILVLVFLAFAAILAYATLPEWWDDFKQKLPKGGVVANAIKEATAPEPDDNYEVLTQLSKEDYDFLRANDVTVSQRVHDFFYPPERGMTEKGTRWIRRQPIDKLDRQLELTQGQQMTQWVEQTYPEFKPWIDTEKIRG